MSISAQRGSTDPIKYRYFENNDNKYLFIDLWEYTNGGVTVIDGHKNSFIVYIKEEGATYRKTPDKVIPLLIKDNNLYAYNKLQFLKIDTATDKQEVLYELPFKGEFPPKTPWETSKIPDMDPNTCANYKFIISTDQIIFQGDKYASSDIIDFCTVDIS